MGVRSWFGGLWKGSYSAVDTRRDYVRQNMPSMYSPTSELSRGTRVALISRVQDGVRNQPLIHGLVERFVTEVIGTGLTPDLVVDHELVDLSEEETRKKEREIEKKFKFFCRSNVSLDEGMNMYEIQRVRYRSRKSSGDVLVNTPIINGELRIELIEGEQVTTPNNMQDTDTVVDGCQLDRHKKITHFFIQKRHPGSEDNNFEWRRFRAVDSRGRNRMFLDKETRRAGQIRGVPTLAVVLDCLHKLDEYSQSELEAALNCADPAMFITSPYNPAAKISKEPIDLYPGAIIDLNPGEEVSTKTPGRPNPEYSPFVRQKITEACIAAKIPVEIFLMLFTASFSASRAGFLMWKKIVMEERQLTSRADDRVFSVWLDNEVEKGKDGGIEIPNYEQNKKYWKTLTWTGPALGSIKELEQIKSSVEKINAGLSTEKKEAAEHGNDINEIRTVRQQEQEAGQNNLEEGPENNVPSD